jgi:hypothetical protein
MFRGAVGEDLGPIQHKEPEFAEPQEPRPLPNRELLALGLANAGGGLFGAMPAGGGTTQTAVNRLAGARSQLAEVVTAAGALVTMLLLAPLIGLMPEATLAAVVIVYSIGMIKPARGSSGALWDTAASVKSPYRASLTKPDFSKKRRISRPSRTA